jgi:hypothetical protein
MPKSVKHVSRNAWPKSNNAVNLLLWAREAEVRKAADEVRIRALRRRQDQRGQERVERLVIDMKTRKERKLELRELSGKERLADGVD